MAGDLDLAGEPHQVPPIYALLASNQGASSESASWVYAAPSATPLSSTSTSAASTTSASEAEGEEGEPAPDLVAFAKALAAAGVKFFGADWCPHCTNQKELFEDGKNYLPFIEVTNPDKTLNAIGIAEGIQSFPTWKFPNGQVREGVLSLEEISNLSGVPIPTGESPTFVALPSTIEVKAGSPLHIPIDAYDPNGGPLTITATSTNPSVVSTHVPTGNRSLKIEVENYGTMVFELFEDKAPRPTARIIQLAQSGFYNQKGNEYVTFHRVIDQFVIQAGDPTGTGSGGSNLGHFDDQFHPDLQHNRTGVLSYAKSFDDTNDSQFFITEGPQRHLDFNHSVFGQLVEGDAVREAISRVPVNSNNRPLTNVNIRSVSVFEDQENGLVMLKAEHGTTGTAQVTVTVTDAEGNSHSQTITVNVVPDDFNSPPFLDDIPPVSTTVNTPVNIQLSSTDIENNPRWYDAQADTSGPDFTVNVNHETGLVQVTPPNNYVGKLYVWVAVRASNATNDRSNFDEQWVEITVAPQAPAAIDLVSQSDTGVSDSDNITRNKQVQLNVTGVTPGAFVTVLAGNTVVGQGTASGSSVTINADLSSLGDGQHTLRATQRVNSETSQPSSELVITLDSTAPTFSSTPPTTAQVGQELTYNAETNGEAAGDVTYSLVGAPAGVQINPTTGVLTWTPTAAQLGQRTFVIEALDKAGNVGQQNVSILVEGEEVVRFRLETTTLDDTPASTFHVNDEFYLNVYVSDVRGDARGVLSAYLDILLPENLVSVVGSPEFGNHFLNDRTVDVETDGLINEAGARADETETGDSEFLLMRVRLKAQATGQATLQGEAADESPEHDVRVIGRDEAVPANQVNFGSATVTITTPFTAVNDVFSVEEDESGTFDVLANDTFPSGDVASLRVVSVGNTSHNGQVSVNSNGQIVYVPAENFAGAETFTYTITDDVHGVATGTVTVNVQPVNDPPTAVDDQFVGSQAVAEDSSDNVLNLLSNDSSAPDVGETLRIIAVGPRSHGGSVTIAPNGTHVTYTPAPDFSGQETFTYTISDGNGGTATATVTVEVSGANDPPVANPDSFTVAEDSPQASFDVLANDTGLDPGETLTITTVAPINNAQGTLVIASDGKSVLYTPPSNFVGQEVFRYVMTDGSGSTSESRVTFTVTPVNDPPTANDDTGPSGRFAAKKDATEPISLDVLRNDSIAPDTNEELTIIEVSTGSQGGTIEISSDKKSILYKPKAGFEGTETFTYTISDGNGGTDTATVEVVVRAFLPSVLGGAVFLDGNGNGVFDSGELPLAGVEIRLQGTDDFGTAVQKTAYTAPDGSYQFADLAPGQYTLTQVQPPFLVDGVDKIGTQGGSVANDRFTIDLDENTQGMGNNFGERSRAAQFHSLRDLFASTSRSGLLLIVDTANNRTTSSGNGEWQQYHDASAKLTADGKHWEITVKNGQQTMLKTTLPNRNSQRLEVLGTSGTMALLRLNGPVSSLNFQPVSPSSGEGESASGAEGEAPPSTFAASSQSASSPTDQVFASQEDAWNAPVDDSLLTALASQPQRSSIFDQL